MRRVLFLGIFYPALAFSNTPGFMTPEVECLNNNTIPFISTTTPANKIVEDAYIKCKPELDAWSKSREMLPEEMRESQYKEFHDFYIRMIEKRRAYGAKK
ncbi:hypothetical protein [Pantoea allii]|uniref:hypothetical protein n=1 Tax=Pantoea allii TaxID=574096 RepID=UPI0024B66499|nr:hypothetical protein [Pantoea allii]MDJ0088088.1 hypothetical protein [Pantoea allii]